MEYVEGGSLAQKLAGTPQPADQAVSLVATLAEAIQVAHQSGIVHRDLKPGNVLLTTDGTPKVTDFGLARRLEDGSGLTLIGVPVGTPSYMAPEQGRGNGDAIGPATDVYALGAILYELLTGRPPFRAETAAATLEQMLADDPVPPSRLNLRVPRDLETICLKCLHKEPPRRYASARELADDLGRFREGKPIRARSVGAAERAVKWARRRPATALLIAALLIMVGSGVGIGLWLRQQEADRQASKAQQEAVKAQQERQAHQAIEMALIRSEDMRLKEQWREAILILTEASTHLAEAHSPRLEQQLRQALSDFRIAADLERVRENSPLEYDGYIYYRKRAAEFQAAFGRAGLEIGKDVGPVADYVRASAIRSQFVDALDDWALAAFILNDGPQVKRLLTIAQSADPDPRWRDRFRDPTIWHDQEQLLRLADNAFDVLPFPSGHQLALLGLLLSRTGAYSHSLQLLGEASRREPGNIWLNLELGAGLVLDDRPREAVAYYRAALAVRPDNAWAYLGLGRALWNAGQTDDALAAYRRMDELAPGNRSTGFFLVSALAESGRWVEAREECRRVFDADPTDYLPPYRFARILVDQQRDEDAIVQLRKAAGTGIRDGDVYSYLARACVRTGRHEEGVTAWRKATELIPVDAQMRRSLARELTAVGRPGEAIAELQSAIAMLESEFAKQPMAVGPVPTTAILYPELGTLLRGQGRPKGAAAAFRKAADLDPTNSAAWDGLAASLLDQGDFAEARAATKHLLDLPAPEAARRAHRQQLDLCDTLLSVEADLPAILADKERPTKAATQRALAEWCLKHGRLPATAARFYDAALSAQPSLADDLEVGNRYHAACAAALAGCGVGEDAMQLDDRRRAVLRRQALDWLTGEYNAWAERHRLGQPGDRTIAATAVRAWQQDKDLAGVRDERALAAFASDERREWQALWAKVAELEARDRAAKLGQAQAHVGRREWAKAARCYAEALELEPTDNGEIWFEYAACQLLAADRAGYRRACAHMLARCGATPNMRPSIVARACTLAPDSVDDWKLPRRLSQDELTRGKPEPWSLTEQAALAHRAGDSDPVLALLNHSLVADARPGNAVLNWLWLALAYQQRGRAEEGRRWLNKAAGWLDQQGGRMPRDNTVVRLHLHGWLEAHVLRQEAEALLRPAAPR
jgi:serine/threonine-protein kinase